MTTVTFETAALADSISKANLVAPTTGLAFDKVAGIMMELDPAATNGWRVLIRSCNLDIFRTEWLEPLEIEGDPIQWRLPGQLFTKVVGSLPIGSGKTVTLESSKQGAYEAVRLRTGRTNARFNLLPAEDYPEWPLFDPGQLTETKDLGGRIAQVEWAAGKSQVPISGIHFDGERCIATDRYKLACAPVVIPGNPEPFTIPAGMLASVLKQTGEVKVGFSGGQFLIMPDDFTQLRCITFGEPYLKVDKLIAKMPPLQITLRKQFLLEITQRAQSYAAGDRDAGLRFFIGDEEIAVLISNQEVGTLGDAYEIPGQAVHDRVEFLFTPTNLIEAISNAPNDEINFLYDTTNVTSPIKIDGGSGYQALVVPRKQNQGE